ncbi:dentin sialophosphoprotein-like protein [Anopheles sinensis]|uniref:Dentin sialophosphoprotein-like protein n=1 Tax=Anopheles sinensis TaxID=74873 RepID=A0A084WT53_ANOSI|nr:dentin sialophosphoprotein-like protein [Anopheles sinensis]
MFPPTALGEKSSLVAKSCRDKLSLTLCTGTVAEATSGQTCSDHVRHVVCFADNMRLRGNRRATNKKHLLRYYTTNPCLVVGVKRPHLTRRPTPAMYAN